MTVISLSSSPGFPSPGEISTMVLKLFFEVQRDVLELPDDGKNWFLVRNG